MKPNELMIGDWVHYGGSYRRVKGLGGLLYPISIEGFQLPFVEVAPIEMNPLILVANKFRMIDFDTYEYYANEDDKDWSIKVTRITKSEDDERYLWSVTTFGSVNTALFEFVHEFQQILRMDGILLSDQLKMSSV